MVSRSLKPPAVTAPPTAAMPQTVLRTRRPTTLRLLLIALSIIVAALASWYVVGEVTTQQRVVMVVGDVAEGQSIEREDLAEVTVGSLGGATSVPADQMGVLVGQQALSDLRPGMLLPQGAVGADPIPRPGHTLVGIRLEQGRLIAGELRPGSQVRLVVTPAASTGEPVTGEPRVFRATVISSEPAFDGAATVVNVEISTDQAPLVAVHAATGQLALVQEAVR